MSLFEDALQFAIQAHRGMTRKRVGTPYILHPMEVAVICGSITRDPEVLAAALLHDTVEDAGVAPQKILEAFGPRVAELVAVETEPSFPNLSQQDSWRLRKEASLEMLRRSQDPGASILWLGDKLSNLRSFHGDWLKVGDRVWEGLHQTDRAQQSWYYRSVRDLTRSLETSPAWREFNHYVEAMFEGQEQQ